MDLRELYREPCFIKNITVYINETPKGMDGLRLEG